VNISFAFCTKLAISTTFGMEEPLFSYGTLQLTNVQLETFGRILQGQKDSLQGYSLSYIKIEDAAVVEASGLTHHPILIPDGNSRDSIEGTVFLLTPEELRQADEYEADDYQRVRVNLVSGASAWVYVRAHRWG
jgi:Gamma-glutamyl cyclotransferase, AIG2-like